MVRALVGAQDVPDFPSSGEALAPAQGGHVAGGTLLGRVLGPNAAAARVVVRWGQLFLARAQT